MEAEDRKSAFLPKKSGNPPKIKDFTEFYKNPQFRGKSAEFTKRLCFCFKTLSRFNVILLILGQFLKSPEFEEIPRNFVKFLEFNGILGNLGEFLPFGGKAVLGKNDPKIIRKAYELLSFPACPKKGTPFCGNLGFP